MKVTALGVEHRTKGIMNSLALINDDARKLQVLAQQGKSAFDAQWEMGRLEDNAEALAQLVRWLREEWFDTRT